MKMIAASVAEGIELIGLPRQQRLARLQTR
jgi:hypothetical protein